MQPPRFFFPAAGILLAVILLPVFFMLAAPLLSDPLPESAAQVSLFEPRQLALARNTLTIALGTVCVTLAFGVPLAFLLCRTDLWARKVFAILSLLPVLIPPHIHAIAWNRLSSLLSRLFSIDLYSPGGVVWVMTFAYLPYVTLLTVAGLQLTDRGLEEAALVCRPMRQTLRKITLPLLAPYILAGAVLVFVFAATDFGVPDILQVRVYSVEIFVQFSAFYDNRAAALLSLPVVLTAAGLVVWAYRRMGSLSFVRVSSQLNRHVAVELRRLQAPALAFSVGLMAFSAGVPLAVLLYTAGGVSSYVVALSSSAGQFAYSALLAVMAALLSTAIGFILAYGIERFKTRAREVLQAFVMLPLAVPAVSVGIGLIHVWNRPIVDAVYESSAMVILGYVARFVPFAVIAALAGLKQIDVRLEEAATFATLRRLKIINQIVLRLAAPALAAGGFIVFVLSFQELGTTLLVIPPGRETVPIRIYNLMHYGADQTVAALCLLHVGLIGVATFVFGKLLKNHVLPRMR
jgi:iron(III) transport system permease protein